MRAVAIASPGGPEVLEESEVEDLPAPGDGEVLLRVAAAGVNRTDTVQRQGGYPPPPGASPYPGVECSGSILALGANVHPRWAVGDQVCALLNGGGYAEKVVVPAGQLLPVPEGVSLTDAAGLPEVASTVWSTVFMTSHLSPGESFLIHGGSSGIGTFAIQMAKHLGIKVFVTAGMLLGTDVSNTKTCLDTSVSRLSKATNSGRREY
uniref:Enoyl reductase (ER) domain-containing protein n=1 Tax=Triticum urartu TaxID=4572 RepID=A0A8R7V185_TRIUA